MFMKAEATFPPLGSMIETAVTANDKALTQIKQHLYFKENFDVVLVYSLLGNEPGYFLASHFNASLVLYSTEQVSYILP